MEQQTDAGRLSCMKMFVVADLLSGVVEQKARLVMFQPEAMDMENSVHELTEGKTA